MDDLLILIDGNSLMYRAFYALPIMNNDKGVFTNAIYGFMSMMLKVIEDEKPTHIAVAFDVHGKTFRHDMYKDYKAGRKPTPDELRPQFDEIKKILDAMQIKTIGITGYEADDIIGTLSNLAHNKGLKTKIITGDKDALQLIKSNVEVVLTKRGITQVDLMNESKLFEEYGLTPAKMIDLKALMGDQSDNIPGIPSVGLKTGIKLLAEYKDFEGVLQNADAIKGKLGEKVRANIDLARLSLKLAIIDTEVPVDITIDDCVMKEITHDPVVPILEKLQLNTIIKKVNIVSGTAPKSSIPEPEIVKIRTLKEVTELIEELRKEEVISIYIGEDVHISNGESEYIIAVMRSLIDAGLDLYHIISSLKPLYESNVPKIIYNAKMLMHTLSKHDIKLNNVIFDIYIASLVLGKNIRGGLTNIIENTLGEEAHKTPATMMHHVLQKQKKMLDERGQVKIFEEIEKPLTNIIYDMETVGFKMDVQVLNELDEEFSEQLEHLTQKIYGLAGREFNINSPKQLGTILFEELGLPSIKKTKTGWSTDVEVLEKLKDHHDIIVPIIKYRSLAKLKGTYIDGIIPLITKEGRLHTQLNQIGASTGRLSSEAPNLQNIPIRTTEGARLRKSFVATDDQHILIDADYSQIELRVLAHISEDETMLEAFNSEDDIHRRTASQVFGVDYDDVTSSMRSSAKAVNFGIVYGISDFGLGKQLNISRREAGEFIEKYFKTFPRVHDYMNECIEFGKEKGYVETMYGRRIYLPQLRSSNYNQRSAAERVAMNAPIQGSAADIIKLAMIAVHNALDEKNYKSKLILQVHDELIVDALKSESDALKKLIKSEMENVAQLKCDLIADVNAGNSWYDAK
ncbi:MAG: DNA polymerase I [Clostridiales bacterium]|nr:DNA polymerase I [Clostridiales bacterium]